MKIIIGLLVLIVLVECSMLYYLKYYKTEKFVQSEFNALVISLKSRPNRLKEFYKNYNLDIECALKEAVDGKTIDEKLLFETGIINDNTKITVPTNGAIGCYLSHYEIWKNVKENEILIVFEDDASLEKSEITIELLKERISELPDDWHIYIIGHPHTVLRTGKVPNTKIEKINEFCGTHAYVINGKGAKTLVDYKNMFPIDKQIDGKMSEMCGAKLLNVYIHRNLPMYKCNDSLPSDIQ